MAWLLGPCAACRARRTGTSESQEGGCKDPRRPSRRRWNMNIGTARFDSRTGGPEILSQGFSRGADAGTRSKTLVGIDLFVGHVKKAGNRARAPSRHLSASFDGERAAPKAARFGVRSGSGTSRSERVFRNEFPLLGRVRPAARATSRLVDGDGVGRPVCRRGPGSCASSGRARAQGRPEGRSEGCPKGAGAGCSGTRPAGSRPRRSGAAGRGPAGRSADPADLCPLDQVLPQGPGRQRQAGLLHRQGRPYRIRASRSSRPSSSSRKASRRRSCA